MPYIPTVETFKMAMSPRLLRPRATGYDPAAQVYFNAVAIADGEQLETAVKKAINDFVIGCKADGIWSAIKASCILMGARTLSGALTPLVGAAPTNNGPFVSGDYNRKTGLLGNGTSKYLDTGRNNNADPQDSKHLSVYKSANGAASGGLIGTSSTASGSSWLFDSASASSDTARVNSSPSVGGLQFPSTGFVGASRSSSSGFSTRHGTSSFSHSSTSQSALNGSILVHLAAGAQYSDARIAFYSIGESLDLALLEGRVSALYTAIGAAI